MASKITLSRSNTEKMAALIVSHSALYALREKTKLVWRWLLYRPSILVGSTDNLRSSFTNHLPFCFRPRVCPRPSIRCDSVSP
jgi:hypothetical protein